MRMFVAAMLGTVALSGAAPANAQASSTESGEQTAENAQRFLSIAMKDRQFFDGRYRIFPSRMLVNTRGGCPRLPSGECWNGSFKSEDIRRAQTRVATSTVQSMAAPDACLTKVVLRTQSAEIVQNYWSPFEGDTFASQNFTRPAIETLDLDWTKVSSARAEGGTLYLSTSQPYSSPDQTLNPVIELRFGDEDLATRAAFAAEVIRLRCDPLSATDF